MRTNLRRDALYGALALATLMLLPGQCLAQSRVEVDAVIGEPFGVGRISLELPPAGRNGESHVSVTERSGRTRYPAVETGAAGSGSQPVRRLLREFIAAPSRKTVYFLFTGDAPLDLSLDAAVPLNRTLRPREDRQAHGRLLQAWWQAYTANGRRGSADYPPLVDNYLQAMLARRLRLPLPQAAGASDPPGMQNIFALLSGTDSLRLALQREVLLGRAKDNLKAELAVPAALVTPEVLLPNLPADIAVEPIAMHVPVECFYVRFGRFNNYLWLRHQMEQWGGDIRNLLSQRGVDYGLQSRMERQIALKESALAQLLGETVIADVALIGTDTFTREGAAVGILFHARNPLGLVADITQQRTLALKREPGATEEKLTIGKHQVSFISTPDNSLRSFYVVDGEFHLVTTSRNLVERFLEAGQGQGVLGAAAEFRNARDTMPADRNHTAFVFLSQAFQRNLLQPQYQIEMRRRLESLAQMDLLLLAQMTAAGEGKADATIDELIAGGFLPRGFGQLPDGSHLVVEDGRLIDSLRGARGNFAPIPDIELTAVTPREARSYQKTADEFVARWQQMDPVLIGLERQPLDAPGLERVALDVLASPFSEKHRQFLSQWIGPATEDRLSPAPGDLMFVQASVAGGKLFSRGPYQLFGALRDPDPAAPPSGGGLVQLLTEMVLQLPQDLRGYVGASPEPGILTLVGGTSDVPADPDGFSRLRTGIWRRQFDRFTVLSLHPEVLEAATPNMGFQPGERPAQLSLWAADLQGTKLGAQLNEYGYRYARRVDQSNIDLLVALSEQMGLAPDEAMARAEELLDANLVSPLGGSYELAEGRAGRKTWLPAGDHGNGPGDYAFPALVWLRGLKAEALLQQTSLSLHAEIDMPVQVNGKPVAPAKGKPPAAAAARPSRPAASEKPSKPPQRRTEPQTPELLPAPKKNPERPKPSDAQ